MVKSKGVVRAMGELTFQFISNFIAITIPLFFVAIMIGDKNSKRIILFFCWGTFAAALAYNINSTLGMNWESSQQVSLIIAPVVEETCKALPVLLFLNRKKYPQLTRNIVFCAMAAGIGFSIQESMYYFAVSSREVADIFILVLRTLTTALMHGMTTTTIGMGLLIVNRRRYMAIPLFLGLLVFAICIHGLYNYLLQTNLYLVAMLIPVVMFAAVWMYIQRLDKD